MSFELKFTPLLGQEESYVTLPKAQLIDACDALLAHYAQRREELRNDADRYPFVDMEGTISATPWGMRQQHITVALSANEQRKLGVSQGIITIDSLRKLAFPVSSRSLKEAFGFICENIRYPRREMTALYLIGSQDRYDVSAWDTLLKQFQAICHDTTLREQIILTTDLKETASAHSGENFIIEIETSKSLSRLFNEMFKLAGYSKHLAGGIVALFENIVNPQHQAETQVVMYKTAVFKEEPFKIGNFKMRKPNPPDALL